MRAQLALVLVPWCPLLATRQMSPCQTLEGLNGKMCELLHTSAVVQKMQGVRAMLGTKRPQPLTAGASWQSGAKRRVRPSPLCIALGPNSSGSLCPRPGFCSSPPKICSSKPWPLQPGTKTFEINQNFEPDARNRRPTAVGAALKMSASSMSDEFDSLDAIEKARPRGPNSERTAQHEARALR